MPCTSGCPTQDHQSYGDCLRSKRLEVGNPEAHKFMQRQSSDLDAYVNARKAGLQPESIKRKDVLYAEQRSEQLGRPFRADKGDS